LITERTNQNTQVEEEQGYRAFSSMSRESAEMFRRGLVSSIAASDQVIHPEHRGHDVPGNSAIPVQGKPRFASLVQFSSVSVQWSALNVLGTLDR